MRTAHQTCIAALLLVSAHPAQTREVQAPGAPGDPTARIAYEAAYYAQFASRTALDMIQQTPGFALQEGLDRRGFSGALGNVLVDGKRPIAKSQSLANILQRIPASQVVRIELLRGGERASEGLGYAVVANVVRTASAGAGVWSLGTEYAGRAPVPNGNASWSGRLGSTDYGLGLNAFSLLRNLPGERTIYSGEGQLTATRRILSPRFFYQLAVNGEATRPMFGGSTRITGQAFISRYHEDGRITSFDAEGRITGDEFNPFTERNRNLEAGVEHSRVLSGWDLTLSGLVTRKRFESEVQSTQTDSNGETLFVFSQDVGRSSGETIVRAALSGSPGADHHIDIGLEAAINSLNQDLVAAIDLGDGAISIPVPNSNLIVRERRAEAYVSHKWTLDSRWSIESRIASEASRLSFDGDAEDSVSLVYVKPSIQVARRIGERNELRLHFYRDVGQLDFTDFVSSASVSDDIIYGGNPDLRPEKSWRLEAVADLRFGASAALNLRLFRYWIDNVVDLVPIGEPVVLFDAPGNIGRGRVDGVQATIRVPLAPLIPGASFSFEGTLKDARVVDPLTGGRRTISDFAETALRSEFRQDVPRHKAAWGIVYTHQPELAFFRFDEIDRKSDSPSLDVWAERNLSRGYRLRLTFLSVLGSPEKRQRDFFDPDRNGDLVRSERWRRNPGSRLLLSVSGQF